MCVLLVLLLLLLLFFILLLLLLFHPTWCKVMLQNVTCVLCRCHTALWHKNCSHWYANAARCLTTDCTFLLNFSSLVTWHHCKSCSVVFWFVFVCATIVSAWYCAVCMSSTSSLLHVVTYYCQCQKSSHSHHCSSLPSSSLCNIMSTAGFRHCMALSRAKLQWPYLPTDDIWDVY